MTPDKLKRLAELQAMERMKGTGLTGAEWDEMHALRRDLAMAPEVADNPATPFTDESRRPQLDGTDYLDEQKKRDCLEATQWLEAFALRVGREAARVAIEAAVAALKG